MAGVAEKFVRAMFGAEAQGSQLRQTMEAMAREREELAERKRKQEMEEDFMRLGEFEGMENDLPTVLNTPREKLEANRTQLNKLRLKWQLPEKTTPVHQPIVENFRKDVSDWVIKGRMGHATIDQAVWDLIGKYHEPTVAEMITNTEAFATIAGMSQPPPPTAKPGEPKPTEPPVVTPTVPAQAKNVADTLAEMLKPMFAPVETPKDMESRYWTLYEGIGKTKQLPIFLAVKMTADAVRLNIIANTPEAKAQHMAQLYDLTELTPQEIMESLGVMMRMNPTYEFTPEFTSQMLGFLTQRRQGRSAFQPTAAPTYTAEPGPPTPAATPAQVQGVYDPTGLLAQPTPGVVPTEEAPMPTTAATPILRPKGQTEEQRKADLLQRERYLSDQIVKKAVRARNDTESLALTRDLREQLWLNRVAQGLEQPGPMPAQYEFMSPTTLKEDRAFENAVRRADIAEKNANTSAARAAAAAYRKQGQSAASDIKLGTLTTYMGQRDALLGEKQKLLQEAQYGYGTGRVRAKPEKKRLEQIRTRLNQIADEVNRFNKLINPLLPPIPKQQSRPKPKTGKGNPVAADLLKDLKGKK